MIPNKCQSYLASHIQGSVLDPILLSLFCNDLAGIANDEDDTEIEMYADDTTIYVDRPQT